MKRRNVSHPGIINANDVHTARSSFVTRLCQRMADLTGSPSALVVVIVVQTIWIVIGVATGFDPYPFLMLLTLSNVLQLVILFVLAVAQRDQSHHDELRAETDHAAICQILYHLDAQEVVLMRLAECANLDVRDVTETFRQLAAGRTPDAPA